MQTNFSARAAREPAHRGSGRDPAPLRALRAVHGDLPDLCAAGRRARQPARAHLPHQGHARGQRAGELRGADPRRPLPVVPLLHDDVPERRRLHAPRRPRAQLHRGRRRRRPFKERFMRGCSRACCPIPSASAWRSDLPPWPPMGPAPAPLRPEGARRHDRAGAGRAAAVAALRGPRHRRHREPSGAPA